MSPWGWHAEKGVGEEDTLENEYFESVMPPHRVFELPHEDCESSVSCRIPQDAQPVYIASRARC